MNNYNISEFYNKLKEVFKKSDNIEIIEFFEKTINEVIALDNNEAIISVENEYASYLRFIGDTDKAYKIYDDVIARVIKTFGKSSKEYASMLLNLGDVDIVAKNYNMAVERFNEAEKIILNLNDNYLLATIYNNRASALKLTNKLKDAESDILKAIKLMDEKILKKAISMINLTEIYIMQGEFEKAKKRIMDTFYLFENNALTEDVHYPNALATAGQLYYFLGDYKTSYNYYKKALDIVNLKFDNTNISKLLEKNLEKISKLL